MEKRFFLLGGRCSSIGDRCFSLVGRCLLLGEGLSFTWTEGGFTRGRPKNHAGRCLSIEEGWLSLGGG